MDMLERRWEYRGVMLERRMKYREVMKERTEDDMGRGGT